LLIAAKIYSGVGLAIDRYQKGDKTGAALAAGTILRGPLGAAALGRADLAREGQIKTDY
jgi:hypothetical protein